MDFFDASVTPKCSSNDLHDLVYEEKKDIKCDICDKILANQITLNRHIASVHGGKKPFKCEICGHNSSQKGHLTLHIA